MDATGDFDPITQRYFALLDALQQAVIATDAQGRILHWSASAEELYGLTADAVLGRSVVEVTPSDYSRAQAAEIMQTLAKGEIWSGEFPVMSAVRGSFVASVTDVPLLNEASAVIGIVGVSAQSHGPTSVHALLSRFRSACDLVWPAQVVVRSEGVEARTVRSSEPHLIQLLSLLLITYAGVLDAGAIVEVAAGFADNSPFADFGVATTTSAVYIRVDRLDERPAYSVFRNVARSAEPTKYASALVGMVGGMLMAGTTPNRLSAMHLLLPSS